MRIKKLIPKKYVPKTFKGQISKAFKGDGRKTKKTASFW
jgi:hypothetical protein